MYLKWKITLGWLVLSLPCQLKNHPQSMAEDYGNTLNTLISILACSIWNIYMHHPSSDTNSCLKYERNSSARRVNMDFRNSWFPLYNLNNGFASYHCYPLEYSQVCPLTSQIMHIQRWATIDIRLCTTSVLYTSLDSRRNEFGTRLCVLFLSS